MRNNNNCNDYIHHAGSLIRNTIVFLFFIFLLYIVLTMGSGCAQIGFPTGGETDSTAPVLSKATPEPLTVNFEGNRITLVFDEYIEVNDLQSNLLVSPLPVKNPTIVSNLRTVSIRLRDTLKPNTTYNLNFGNAIADVHENNVLKNFSYTFSTGPHIDSLSLSGKVLIAETGRVDSTLQVLLYQNPSDTDVVTRRPDYITRVDGQGNFIFRYLPASSFKVYALKDGDGGKTYNAKTEIFGFNDQLINTATTNRAGNLFAYAEENATATTTPGKPPAEKKLTYITSVSTGAQDLLKPFQISFNSGLKEFAGTQIYLTDTNYRRVPNVNITLDSTRSKVTAATRWLPESPYVMIIQNEGFEDSAGNKLAKSDTIRFSTKRNADYGKLVLRFRNIDLSRQPVIQFFQNNNIQFSAPVTSQEWSDALFPPGEFEVRILYDNNKNGKWDPGNYQLKLQPERVVSLPQKLAVRADWENEREIQL